jgi:urease accessory protein
MFRHRPFFNRRFKLPSETTMMHKLLLIAGVLLYPSAALAHSGSGEASGYMLGFAHPFQGVDHILAMVAVGVLAGAAGGRFCWLAPLAFIAAMIAGFAASRAGLDLPLVEPGIAISGVALLALAALSGRIGTGLVAVLIGLFAVLHGHAHGTEMDSGANGVAYVLGFVAATAALHAAGLAAVIWGKSLWRRQRWTAAR